MAVHMATQRAYSWKHYATGSAVAILLMAIIVVHTYFAGWLLRYVNDVLHHIHGYEGAVQSIDIDLYRGAYRLNKLVLNKKEGAIPTPFISIEVTDFSVQWRALMHGRIVSDVTLIDPVINFAVNKTVRQAGENVDWTVPIKQLMPIDINRVRFTEGKISYQDFASTPNVNIYIHHMRGEITNLRNVVNGTAPLPSFLTVEGDSIGNGSLSIRGKMNILKQVPDMELLTKIEDVHLPALNDYSNAYGGFDFKDGDFSLYSKFIIKDNEVSGYIKPVAEHIAIIDLRKESNPVKLVWESFVSAVITLFTNHTHDQFATPIPLEGSLHNIQTNIWATIGNIFYNAFINALKKGFDSTDENVPLHQSPSQ